MVKPYNKLFLSFSLVGTLLLAALVFVATYKVNTPSPIPPSLASNNPTTAPSQVSQNSKESVLSPDGKYTLTKANTVKDNGLIYQAFSITSETDATPVIIFTKDSAKDNLLTIPYNTFSPTDKYIFLEYSDAGKTKNIVLRTDGKEIVKGKQFVEIESTFYDKYPDFVITEVTGWGGYSLVIFNTKTSDGKEGPSWWFDLSNLSFIRLSTKFN